MIKKLFTNVLYIKISENKFEAKNISVNGNWVSAYPDAPFTTNRLLVGTFSAAEPTLSTLIKSVRPKGIFAKRPQVVMHPTSRVEGGLSEVEERIFKELALGAGAIEVKLHIGHELTDLEATDLFAAK